MTFALFGIENDGLNLAVNLLVFFLVVIWVALVYWTYSDASRRLDDPLLIGCATVASLFPFIGTIVYAIVRPPEYLEDAHERELEIKAAEKRLALLDNRTCRNCGSEIEPNFLRCPSCMRKLKEPCRSCGRPLDPRWRVCPYCEAEVAGRPGRSAASGGVGLGATATGSRGSPAHPARRRALMRRSPSRPPRSAASAARSQPPPER